MSNDFAGRARPPHSPTLCRRTDLLLAAVWKSRARWAVPRCGHTLRTDPARAPLRAAPGSVGQALPPANPSGPVGQALPPANPPGSQLFEIRLDSNFTEQARLS